MKRIRLSDIKDIDKFYDEHSEDYSFISLSPRETTMFNLKSNKIDLIIEHSMDTMKRALWFRLINR